MRVHGASNEAINASFVALGLVGCVLGPMLLDGFGTYQTHRRESIRDAVAQLLFSIVVSVVMVSGVAFALTAPIAPLFPLAFGGVQFAALTVSRATMFGTLHYLRRSGRNYRNLLIVGCGPRAVSITQTILAHPEWGIRIAGYVDDGTSAVSTPIPEDQIAKFIDVPRILRDRMIDEVLIACPRTMLPGIAPVVEEASAIGVPVTLLSDLFGDHLPPPRVGLFDSLVTLSFAPVQHNQSALMVKRAIDIVGSIIGLLLAAPILGVAALAIRIESGGCVLFRQKRAGLNGRPFQVLKLRTMFEDAESRKKELLALNEMDGPVFKISNDPRITRVGAILRKWSLDELPQLWNVLCGDMSLVGPRPPTFDEIIHYSRSDRRRLSMRPGITCIWQVSGRNTIGFNHWMRLDLLYIDTWSIMLDFRILLQTVPAVLLRKGAS